MHIKIYLWFLIGLALAGAAFGASCSPIAAPTATQLVARTSTPTTTSAPTLLPATPTRLPSPTMAIVTPAVSSTPVTGIQLRLNLDAIFPPGRGRELVLNDCTTCHTFLRIVIGQRTKDQWEYVKRDMRGKVSQLSDQDVDTLFAYLEANFNETKPAPDLPDWFLQTGEW